MKPTIKARELRGENGMILFGSQPIKQGDFPVNMLVYHRGIHWDEVVANFLIRKLGNQFFPGVATAKVRFASREEAMLDPVDALKRGELWVGCGESPFNEHETMSRGAVENHCAATLIATLLGHGERKELRVLLNDVLASDRDPQRDVGHIHNVIKSMHEVGMEDETILAWGTEAVKAIHMSQVSFWLGAVANFDEFGKIEEVKTERGETLRLAIITTDDRAYSRVALGVEPRGKNASVVLSQNEAGNLTVLTNKRHHLPAWLITEVYRVMALKHFYVTQTPIPDEFRKPGNTLPENAEGLHLWTEGGGILNKGTPAGFTLEEAASIIRGVINRLRTPVKIDSGKGRYHPKDINHTSTAWRDGDSTEGFVQMEALVGEAFAKKNQGC